jgi:endonuclease/exonuclease/phosphatase family metal-dependent hydrolase
MRIVSFNTWKGENAYLRRLDLMASGLRAVAPDIVCLQEALQTRDRRLDTARRLARVLGLQRAWTPARLKIRRVEGGRQACFSGLAILSRYPIEQHQQLMLPSDLRDPERCAQWIDISVNGKPQRVVNLHLTHIRDADSLRRRQWITLLKDLDRSETPDRVWLCGDFNAAPASMAIDFRETPPGWRMVDAYTAGGGRRPGRTWPVSAPPGEGRRIDRILSLTRNGAATSSWRRAATVLTQPDAEGFFPSDHAGVMVETAEE